MTNLTGKKEVGRAMSNCIEKVVRRTFGRDDIHRLEMLEASSSTSKYCKNTFTYFDATVLTQNENFNMS